MVAKKKRFVVRILASVHTEDDKEMENPNPVLIDIPVRARTVDEAQEKVGLAIAEKAELQQSSLDYEEVKKEKELLVKQMSTQSVGMAAEKNSWETSYTGMDIRDQESIHDAFLRAIEKLDS